MQPDRQLIFQKAGAYWNNYRQDAPRTRWWQSPTIVEHVNRKIDPKGKCKGRDAFHYCLSQMRGAPFVKAVSVGCGEGGKERALIQEGVVGHFDLFEISSERVEKGREAAEREGLSARVRYCLGDAFTLCREDDYDLVYWNNSLHHMLDAREALQWSHDRLKPGGVFAMNDFVGASRFQWSDMILQVLTDFRASLPEHLLSLPRLGKQADTRFSRPSLDYMMSMDPTEAADSENILPALREIFPGAYVIPTGGHIYFTGLNNILQNFEEHSEELRMALHIDDLLSKAGENLYAVAFARKVG